VVVDDLRAAAAHLSRRPTAARAIVVVAAQRFCATLTLTAGVLLYRSTYASADDPQAGLTGLSVAVLAAGAGFVLAAVVTTPLVERWSTRVAVTGGLLVGALAQLVFAASLAETALVTAAFALGLGGQVVKICADTQVQRVVDDVFRGRVFVLYDMAFNVALVAATCLGAVVLPPSGRAPGVMAVVAGALLVVAVLNARAGTRARSR
jgi:MFS family permease